MNRFRTKKKAKEPTDGLVRASTDSESPGLPALKPSKTFRLGKKQQHPEPKLQLDLANALPSSDDFRTSLLMNGLSARFSMLREQDDPLSKIGKASDDSVLFPPTKRQSRLNDFGFQPHGLSDIAEVSSINGSVRPWAVTRADSYKTVGSNGTDDDSLHSGGIMNRAKPGEGNNLFGGRQKIYKIPLGASGSTRSLTEGGGPGMGGRAMYESDISQSTFQQLREREKEQPQDEREESEEYARSGSPTYNRNRETSSTTSSAGPSITRNSTAATSVTSQRAPSLVGSHTPISPGGSVTGNSSADRPANKGRRLYETGLDQHLHEQQFSAMNRIDTLTRHRVLGTQTPPLGRNSPTGISIPVERWDRHQITGKASMPNMRTASPSPTVAAMGAIDLGARHANLAEPKLGFGMPPLSPPMSENDDHAVLTVQPNDRGKATALGAFSKPAQPYDETKYSQRQLQMQQGRETPPPRKNSPPRVFAPRQQVGRNRTDSNATYASTRSRSNSSAQRHFLPADRIPGTAPTSNPNVPAEEAVTPARASPEGDASGYPHAQQTDHPKGNMQLIRDLANMYRRGQELPLERPPESQHPAHRQRSLEPEESSQNSSKSQSPAKSLPPLNTEEASTPSVTVSSAPADSPTLGPTTELTGLSGMVRQHLRSDSNTSSVYGIAPSNTLNSHEDEPLPQNEYTIGKHPSEGDDWDQSYDENTKSSLDLSPNSNKTDDALPPPVSSQSPNVKGNGTHGNKSWEKDPRIRHTRDGSSETQKEREDFQNDLAARRRKVQENLKSFVETETRSASPLPGSDLLKDVGLKANPLGLLKSKTSRGSLVGRPKEYKSLKAAGNGPNFTRSSSPGRGYVGDDPWMQEDEEELRFAQNAPTLSPPTKAFRQARRDAQRDRERLVALRHQQRAAETAAPQRLNRSVEDFHRQRDPSRDRAPPNIRTRHQTPSRERKPPPVTFTQRNGNNRESQGSAETNLSASRPASRTSRDRSSSDASGRSRSRNGRYKDDLAKPIPEGPASPSKVMFEDFDPPSARVTPRSPHVPVMASQSSPVPSPVIGSDGRTRSRSNSRSTPGGYFEPHKLQTIQTGEVMDPVLSPRPPLMTSFSGNSTTSLAQSSPASSAANTPTVQGFQTQGSVPAHRKRSVNKSDISEPRFVSTTSRMTTVNLPPGASLQNGIEPPPIPPVNPRRKTPAVFRFGKKEEVVDYPSPLTAPLSEDRTTFSDEGEAKVKPRQKLRKISSEGGNLHARTRQAILAAPSPVMPEPAPTKAEHVDGGMF
jgi:hypothetical protein